LSAVASCGTSALPIPLLAASGRIELAMLHLEPQLGELDANTDLYERAIGRAAKAGANWILTPELGLTGYYFVRKIGTDWIKPGVDRWVERIQRTAARYRVTIFLGHLELDSADANLYNTMFVIGRDGEILGRHRKINTIPISEAWSKPGKPTSPIRVDNCAVGALICADAWLREPASALADDGAEVLISSATWPPKPHGPERCWEQRTIDTGLPLFVCNRTGVEFDFDMRDGESVIVNAGQRLVRHISAHSSILLAEWEFRSQLVTRHSAIRL
jgi:5-aminopentanamidase